MPERAVAFDNSVLSALVKSAVDPKLLNPVDQDRAKRARNFMTKRPQSPRKQADPASATNRACKIFCDCSGHGFTPWYTHYVSAIERDPPASELPESANATLRPVTVFCR